MVDGMVRAKKNIQKIIRLKNFRGVLLPIMMTRIIFSERWISFDEKNLVLVMLSGFKVKGNYLLLRDDLVHLLTVFVQSKSFVKQILQKIKKK
jgi:hypothetical protein